ncbi:hypothetical protein LNJ40_06900 [Tenacibaculum dicentrarchi]|nr:hypothetical protein [Tenacibaculum dicentrarchi]
MKELKSIELDKKLKEFVSEKLDLKEEIDRKEIQLYLNTFIQKKAVLGFDIYQYSQYASTEQALIPHLFKKLYATTIRNCIKNEPFFFKYKNQAEFENKFIDTGDGGFQIFDSPIESLIFSIYFQANIVRYNSGNKLLSDLYNIIGEINLRYSLTYDDVHNYKNNFYGPAIINCARIMSKDNLNRFLLDDNTISWFNSEINSLETCLSFEPEKDFPTIPIFKSTYDNDTYKSLIFGKTKNLIKSIDILKIGEIKSKLDILSIFSIHIQVMFISSGKAFRKYRISLGNLNSSGLIE